MKKICIFFAVFIMALFINACGVSSENTAINSDIEKADGQIKSMEAGEGNAMNMGDKEIPENFVLIEGGTFKMGSPDTENWRSKDETQHTVTVSDFYMSIYEVTQAEYVEVMGSNPSNFSGESLPVENVSWLDAVRYLYPNIGKRYCMGR